MGRFQLCFVLLSILLVGASAAPLDPVSEPEPTGINVDGVDVESFRDSEEPEPIQVLVRETEVETPTAEDDNSDELEQQIFDSDTIVLKSNQDKRSDSEDEEVSERDVSTRSIKNAATKIIKHTGEKTTPKPDHEIEGRSVELIKDQDDSELDISKRGLFHHKKDTNSQKGKVATAVKTEHEIDGRSVEQLQEDEDDLSSEEEGSLFPQERSIPISEQVSSPTVPSNPLKPSTSGNPINQEEPKLILRSGSLWSEVNAAADAHGIPPCPTAEEFYLGKADTFADLRKEKTFVGDIGILLDHVSNTFHGMTKCMRRLIADLKLAVGIKKMNKKTKKQIKLQQTLSKKKPVKIVTAAEIAARKKAKKVVSAVEAVVDKKPQILSSDNVAVADKQNPVAGDLTKLDVPTKIGVADILPGAPPVPSQSEPALDVAAPDVTASSSDPDPEAAENPAASDVADN